MMLAEAGASFGSPMRGKLTQAVQRFVVRELARSRARVEIVAAVGLAFGVRVAKQTLRYYHPERNPKLALWLREVFAAERERLTRRRQAALQPAGERHPPPAPPEQRTRQLIDLRTSRRPDVTEGNMLTVRRSRQPGRGCDLRLDYRPAEHVRQPARDRPLGRVPGSPAPADAPQSPPGA